MILIYNDKHPARNYGGVMEDVDPNKKRIFINRMGLDIDTLGVRFGEFFMGQNAIDQVALAAGDNWYNDVPIQTSGKWAWGMIRDSGRQSSYSPPGHMDPWFASLDYENFPGRRSFVTSKGLTVYQQFSGYSTNDGTTDWWVGNDMSGPADYYIQANAQYVTVFEEDIYNDSFYGINYDNGTYYVGKFTISRTVPTWTSQRSTTTGHFFYLGRNTKDNSFMFIEHSGANGQLTAYAFSGNSTGTPPALFTSTITHPNATHYQYPSNLWHKSPTEKIFYQGHYDNNLVQDQKELIMYKFEWNPSAASMTQTQCNMVYPAGTEYTDFHRMAFYTSGQHSNVTNNWFYKPHFFTFNNVNYVTYIYIDKSGPTGWAERVNYDQYKHQARWITYSISEDGNTLTYHSFYEFTVRREIPAYYMPLNSKGTQLLTLTGSVVTSMNFSTSTGWYVSDTELYSVRSVGIDSMNRVFMGTRYSFYDTSDSQHVGKGYYSIHQYIPPDPIVVEVNTASSEYVYQNANINTTLTVNALNSVGSRVVADIKLVITNNCMTFAGGLNYTTVTTSSSSDTVVDVVIVSSGKPTIVSSIAS